MSLHPRDRGFATAWCFVLLVSTLLASAPASAQKWQHPAPDLATLIGEELEFRLSWQGITAANARLEVIDSGEGKIEFRATARTVGLAHLLYPVRSQIRSTSEIAGFRSVSYIKDG